MSITRRGLILRGFGVATLAGATTAGYAGAIEPYELQTTRYALTPPRWPARQR